MKSNMRSRCKKYFSSVLFFLILFLSTSIGISAFLPIEKAAAEAASCQASSSQQATNLQPQVGGVALDQAATFLADMDDITGAYYDNTLDRIVFVGKKNTALPEFDKDDLAVAIKAIFFKNAIPAVNIDNDPIDPTMLDVLYSAGIENTRFGKVLFDADYAMKLYGIGHDANGTRIVSSVPGYKNVPERYFDKNPTTEPVNNRSRWWITPKLMSLKKDDAAGAFVFDQAVMEVNAEQMSANNDPKWNEAAEEFAQHQTQYYDQFAQETPVYADAKQLGKIVSVVKWLADMHITTDFDWAWDYEPKIVATPKKIPKIVFSGEYNGRPYTFSGGVNYFTPNSYTSDTTQSVALKAASQAIPTTKEDIHWSFTKDGVQYESVAVAADAFRSLGSYSTTVTDMSFPAIGDTDLSFSRTYSSFSGGQNGIGRGWSFLPAQLVDNMPLGGGTIAQAFCTTAPQNFFKRASIAFVQGGTRETFVYINPDGICKYQPQENFYHSQVLVGKVNVNVRQYEVTAKDQTKYVFEEYYQDNGVMPQVQSLYSFKLIHIKDHNGNKINYTYDTQQRLTSISDDKNHVITLSYNTKNLVSQIADWTNRTVKYGYDAQGNLISVTDPQQSTTTYTYDTNNKLTKITSREGETVVTNSYTPEAKLATQTDAGNTTRAFSYNDTNRTINIADSATPAKQAVVTYDQRARILEESDAFTNKRVFTYGSEYAPLSVKDKNNNTTSYTYDSNGNITSTIYPDGKKVTFAYNTQNRVTKIADERYVPTKVTDLFYYAEGNIDGQPKDNLWAIQGDGKKTLFKYYPDGQVEGIWDSLNHLTHWSYDDFGNKMFQVYADSKFDRFYSNALGQIYWHTDGAGKPTAFAYDGNNNLVGKWEAINTPQQALTEYQYDKENRLKKTILPNNAATNYSYNGVGSVVGVTDAGNNTTAYTYDTYQNLVSKKDALNRTTQYSYDFLNRRTQLATPLGNILKWEYDANGNLSKRIDEENKSTSYQYNPFNRLVKTTYPDTASVNRSYDSRNNLTQLVDPTGTSTYTYDVFDRLTKAESGIGGVNYQYDLTDKLTKITYPDGKNVSYGYDVDNTLVSVTDWNNKVTNYAYYDNNLVQKKTLPNGIETSYVYDNANRLTEMIHKKGTVTLAKFTYERNSIGGITKVTEEDSFSPVTAPPSTTSTLLSQGKSIVASTQKGGYEATKANDGSIGSYWEAQNTYPATLTIDLGAVYPIDKVVMKVDWGGRTENVEILGSSDNSTFTTIVPSANYNLGTVPVTFTPVNMRYVRLKVNSNSAASAAQIAEFEVWGGGSTTPPPATSGYTGEYFNNVTLSGTPVLTRSDATINFEWGGNAPDPAVPADNFSVRWTKTQAFAAGTYEFSATADDGIRLYLDGVKIFDRWIDQAPTTYKITKDISEGNHTIVYEYYEKAYGAVAKLSYEKLPAVAPSQSYAAQYFSNISLSGTPTLTRVDNTINFDWGGQSPDITIPVDNFSARWTRTDTFSGGPYEFSATGDDGIRLYVDGVKILDKWIDQGPTTYKVTKDMTVGNHTIVYEYYEKGGGATAKLSFIEVASTATGTWTYCANENQTCSFSGTKQVRYGANTSYFYKTATTSIPCNNATFGDPIPLTAKQCSYLETTAQPTATPTPTPTPNPGSGGTQLLPSPWNLVGNNGSSEKYQSMSSTALQGMDTMRITYNLHGLQALGGDASAIIIDQGGWKFVSLSNYGQNGLNGSQTVDIPLSDFQGLNLANSVDGTIHTRFWYGSSFTVDITSIIVLKKNTAMGMPLIQKIFELFTPKIAFAQTAPQLTVASFTYDLVGRLVNAVYPAINYIYTYDSVGNRLTNKKNTTSSTATYNADNQLTQADTIQYTYDKKGNQLQAGQKTYGYTFDNKLASYTDGAAAVNYTYDGLGNRIAVKVGNTTTQFVNDVSGSLTNVLVAKNTTNNTSNFFVQGPEVISEGGTASENRKYYLTDGMGHIRFVTDANGNHLQSISYDPYGNPLNTDSTSVYKFKGEQADEGGMIFMRARYYDPLTGRFISKDPVEGVLSDPRSQNGYDYAWNDPINLSDPSGMDVYGGFDASETLRYVGRTCRDVAQRTIEHLSSSDPVKANLDYRLLHKIPDILTDKGSEQTYIDTYGLVKDGGQLVNKINSVSPNNPILSQAKDQAQAAGAVPVAAGGAGIIEAIVGAGVMIIDPLLIIMVNPPAPASNIQL